MPRNKNIIEHKPQNEVVIDFKPNSEAIINWKPKQNVESASQLTDQLYEVTLGAGQLVGFGPAITYPEAIDITSSKSP